MATRSNQAALFIGGFRGEQVIRTNPATQTGVSYVHPFQAYFSGPTFLAVGTYKGRGANGDPGSSSCPDNYSGTWSLYTDGENPAGQYFCVLEQADAFDVGHSPHFRIAESVCADGNRGWAAFVNGDRKTCRGAYNDTATGGGAGLEVVAFPTTQGYNIDVIHRDLELYSNYLGMWYDLGANRRFRDDPYHLAQPNDRRIESYLGTLD